jgi:hypothetical protein
VHHCQSIVAVKSNWCFTEDVFSSRKSSQDSLCMVARMAADVKAFDSAVVDKIGKVYEVVWNEMFIGILASPSLIMTENANDP